MKQEKDVLNKKVENIKTIFGFQLVVTIALGGCLLLIELGTDRDILTGVCIGFLFSLAIQFALFRLKAAWFDGK